MKKLTFATIALIVLFSAHQVSAVSNNANSNSKNNPSLEMRNENSTSEIDDPIEVTTEPTKNVPSISPSEDWKNHGEYVKSVAQTHPGGKTVSEAARSKIGKKSKTPSSTPSVSPSVSPTTTPTTTPSGTITPTPTDDPNATPTATPSVTVTPTVTETQTPTPVELPSNLGENIESLIEKLQDLIDTLKDAFNI